jgi:alpha-amylase/alpha-mannosidase (GH57 family)
MPHD